MRKEFTVSNGSQAALNLWLVDDQGSIRDLFAELLSMKGTIRCSRQFSSAEAVLEALARETPPEAILLDIRMGGMSGIEAIRPIKRLAGSTRVFIMTTIYDSIKKSQALGAGASGFFLKSGDVNETIKCIETAPSAFPTEKAEPATRAVSTSSAKSNPARWLRLFRRNSWQQLKGRMSHSAARRFPSIARFRLNSQSANQLPGVASPK